MNKTKLDNWEEKFRVAFGLGRGRASKGWLIDCEAFIKSLLAAQEKKHREEIQNKYLPIKDKQCLKRNTDSKE